MVPVRNGEDKLFIVFKGGFGIVNHEGSSETVRILAFVVGVIPVGTRLVDGEVVGEAGTWGDRTLCDHDRTVHVVGPVHEQAMEVERGVFVTERVVEVDNEAITNLDIYPRRRPLVVDSNDRSLGQAVWIGRDP